VHLANGAEEPDPVYLFMLANFLHHLVHPLAVVFQHLKVSGVQDDFTDGFNIILGIHQEELLEGRDIEKSEQGDGNQQDNTGSESELADQTVAEHPEDLHH
jgi:hypothetical protein